MTRIIAPVPWLLRRRAHRPGDAPLLGIDGIGVALHADPLLHRLQQLPLGFPGNGLGQLRADRFAGRRRGPGGAAALRRRRARPPPASGGLGWWAGGGKGGPAGAKASAAALRPLTRAAIAWAIR